MNQHDLMKAIRELPDETVEKYALPKHGNSGLLHQDNAAGKENIIMTDTSTEKKSPIRAHRAGIAAVILLCLGLNAGLFFGISRMNKTMDAHSPVESIADYKMPDLIGMDYQEAVLMYGDVLSIEILSQEYSEYNIDRIFDQDIEPGTPIQKGDTVHVKVSIGTKRVELPDVTGWDFETAKTQLLGLGLYVDQRNSYDDEVPEGKVISTDPEAPVEIEPGSYVRVMVSLGPNKDTVAVPNFVGMNWDLAKEMADGMCLVLAKNEVSDEAPAGTILEQDLATGTEVSEETVITVNVSTGGSQPAENGVRIAFNIPSNVSGMFHIALYENGVAKAVGAGFNPEVAAGVTALTIEGEGTTELTAELFNDDTNAHATIGTYQIDFDNKTSQMTSGDINAAFEAVS